MRKNGRRDVSPPDNKSQEALLAVLTLEEAEKAKKLILSQPAFKKFVPGKRFLESRRGKVLVQIVGNYWPWLMEAGVTLCTEDTILFIGETRKRMRESILISHLSDPKESPVVEILSHQLRLTNWDYKHNGPALRIENYKDRLLIYRQSGGGIASNGMTFHTAELRPPIKTIVKNHAAIVERKKQLLAGFLKHR